MRKGKEVLLAVGLAVVLCLTLAVGVLLFLSWEKEAIESADNIAGLLTFALTVPVVIGCYASVILSEISVYFNLRYFLLCEEKNSVRTVLNRLMLILSGVHILFLVIGLLTDAAVSKIAASLCTGAFGLMLLLRIIDLIAVKLEKLEQRFSKYQ